METTNIIKFKNRNKSVIRLLAFFRNQKEKRVRIRMTDKKLRLIYRLN